MMDVDYQAREWGGSVCGDGCGLPGECGEGVCVVMGVDYQARVWGGCAGERGWSGG